jgi:hypothetical protein
MLSRVRLRWSPSPHSLPNKYTVQMDQCNPSHALRAELVRCLPTEVHELFTIRRLEHRIAMTNFRLGISSPVKDITKVNRIRHRIVATSRGYSPESHGALTRNSTWQFGMR